MRAHWLNPLPLQEEYILTGDSLHHLVNVVRVESGEPLLLLNGAGLWVETIVQSLNKKELRLKKISHSIKERPYQIDLALGMPKREALELCLKEATELGFRKIFLIKSEFSQMRFPEHERMQKLLISALEQSNAPFMPEVSQGNWEDLPWTNYQEAFLLDSQTKKDTPKTNSFVASTLLIVGPEGGFSPAELKFLHSRENINVVNLPTPILRTPTAVAAGAGIIFQNLLK